jgi:hypothetical protein
MFGFLQVASCYFEIEVNIVYSTHHHTIELTNCTCCWHFKVVYLMHILLHSNKGVFLKGLGFKSPPPPPRRIPFKSFHMVCFPSILVHTNVSIFKH